MTAQALATYYDNAFYDEIDAGALRSAEAVVPLVLALTQATSVIDVGCGRGAWLKVFGDYGIADLHGVDGDHVDRSALVIPANSFSAADLTRILVLDRRFDLAVCLEVAEHLPARSARGLVKSLVNLASCVLFSAAIPGQGGTHHVNEQWPWYWRNLFSEHGFVQLDAIRRQICLDQSVHWWYRQNLFLYVAEHVVQESPALRSEACRSRAEELEFIHGSVLTPFTTVRGLLRALPRAIGAALRRRAASW